MTGGQLALPSPVPAHRFLPAGEVAFGGGHVRVETILGTCVAITLWHPQRQIGGMCHYLLPSRGRSPSAVGAARGLYADEVMESFADSLLDSRTQAQEYTVKMFGGGHMFPQFSADFKCREQLCTDALRVECPNVGCQNIGAGRRLLAERGFRIASQDVGGDGSRRVLFDLWSGDVWVKRGSAFSLTPVTT